MKKGIIIGAGKSFWDTDLLEQLISSNFDGLVFISDRIIENCIMRGYSPLKFKTILVTQESMYDHEVEKFISFYKNKWVLPYQKHFRVWLCSICHHSFIDQMRQSFDVHIYDRKAKPSPIIDPYAPTIETCHNVGMACFALAHQVHGCDQLGLIGMDLTRYEKDTGSYDTWDYELSQSLNYISYHRLDVSTFNFSPYSRLISDDIVQCPFEDFMTDNYRNKQRDSLDVVY